MRKERLPAIAPEDYSPEQRQAAAAFMEGRKTPVFGPFAPLMYSPELMLAASNMGLYLRYRSALPLRISEFTILIVARHWNQQLEWAIHHPIALKEGVLPAVAEAIAEGRRPEGMTAAEAAAYAFSQELLHNRAVSDATYAQALERFGERGVIDLAGINGYYGFLAGVMNVARTAAPGGVEPLAPLA